MYVDATWDEMKYVASVKDLRGATCCMFFVKEKNAVYFIDYFYTFELNEYLHLYVLC